MSEPDSQWEEKLERDDYPLFTIGVAAELLDVDVQVIRRMEDRGICDPARPAGNQRRYSRADLARIAQAIALADDGVSGDAIGRIVELEARVADLEGELEARRSPNGDR